MRGDVQPGVELTPGIRLRPWRQDDAGELLLAMRDPLVQRYSGFVLTDRAEALTRLSRYASSWADGVGACWAIAQAGGVIVGSVGFGRIDGEVRTGSVGYWLSPEVRGAGVASAAVRAATRIVFERLRWHRIELYHAVENERSCATARRCGYRLEGIMREAMCYPIDGRWSDEHLHARLAHDPAPD